MVGTKEGTAAAITAKGVVVAHKKTAAITKPTVVGNGGHKGNGNTKSKKGKKGKNKTATWSYGAPKNVVLQNSLYTSGYGSLTWQNLHEADCLASLPEPLRSLVHFKQLSREMLARTMTPVSYGGATTSHSMEGHRQTVDMAYLTALQQYIATLEEEEENTAANADEQNNIENVAEEEEPEEKKDDDPEGQDPERKEEGAIKTQQEHKQASATKTAQLFHRAETMAFLYRYASSLEEQQVLHDEYRKQTAKYIVQMLAGQTNATASSAVVAATAEEPDEDNEEVEAAEAPGTGEREDEDDQNHHHGDAAVAAATEHDIAAMEGVEE